MNNRGSLAVEGEGETPQPLYAIDVLASVTLFGRSSVKLRLEIADVPGLVIVNVRVDIPPGRIVFGENDLVRLALIILAYRVETPKSAL